MKKIFLILFGTLILSSSALIAAEPDTESYKQCADIYEKWSVSHTAGRLFGTKNDRADSLLNELSIYLVRADNETPENGYINLILAKALYLVNKEQDSWNFANLALTMFNSDDSIGIADTYILMSYLSSPITSKIEGISPNAELDFLNKAVSVAPDYYKARIERGNHLNIWKNDYENAYIDYQKAIEVKPDEVEPYSRLIWSYKERGMIDKAEEYCRKCIAAVKEYPHHYDSLCEILLGKGEILQARDLLWTAFEIYKGDYFQGPWTISLFPKKEQDWFVSKIKEKALMNPQESWWEGYLEHIEN